MIKSKIYPDVTAMDYGHADTQGIYLQDTMALTDKWTIVSGLRLEHKNGFGHYWAPKIAANYRADDKTKIYASWGRVFNMLSSVFLHRMSFLYGVDVSTLKPEAGHTEMIGLEHNFDENSNVRVNFFRGKLDHTRRFNWGDPDELAFLGSRNKQHGFEVSFNQNLSDKWSYDIAYTHTNETEEYVRDDWESVDKNNFVPMNNCVSMRLHYACGDWRANLDGLIGGDFPSKTSPSKTVVLDFNTSYAVSDNVLIYFRARNFTNQPYDELMAANWKTIYGWGSGSSSKRFQIGVDCKF